MAEFGRPRWEERTLGHGTRSILGCKSSDVLNPSDFSDVFGGPPRSVFFFDFPSSRYKGPSTSVCEQIFGLPEEFPAGNSSRSLCPFQWSPDQSEEFYSDIFCSDNVSTVNSDELSPSRVTADDSAFSTVCSSQRCASRDLMVSAQLASYVNDRLVGKSYNDCYRRSGLSGRPSSPETINLYANDHELKSPLAAFSSIYKEGGGNDRDRGVKLRENKEIMSSFLLEISLEGRDGLGDADAIDEAVAWAKEKFMTCVPEEEREKEI